MLLAIFFCSANVWADSATRNAEYRDRLVPLLRTDCLDCHGAGHAEGDVKIDKYESGEAVLGDRKEWMRKLKQVQLGSLPPIDGTELTSQTRAWMINQVGVKADPFGDSTAVLSRLGCGPPTSRRREMPLAGHSADLQMIRVRRSTGSSHR